MSDRFDSMEAFVKSVDLGSFTAAATALGLTSQMVGKHVRHLEQRLGTPLLHRSTRRQSLTDAGLLFYERCRTALAQVELAEAVVEDMSARPRGRLRISAPVGFGACRLAPLLIPFAERYPEIGIDLVLTDHYVDLVGGGFDAVLRLGPIGESAFVARRLAEHQQIACASPDYLSRRGHPRSPADLCGHDCLGFVNASGLPYADWHFTAKDGTPHPVRIRTRFQVNDGRVLAEAAAAGGGIILQPEAVLRQSLDSGRLVPVLADFIAPGRPMFLLFSTRRPQPPKLRVFIDMVVAAMPPDDGRPIPGRRRPR